MNVVLLQGELSSEPRVRTLESGSLLMNWELTTETDGKKHTVPVSWFDPPASIQGLAAGEAVVVLGVVRRRFYHANGGLQSATDVLGERGARLGRTRSAAKVADAALERVLSLADSSG